MLLDNCLEWNEFSWEWHCHSMINKLFTLLFRYKATKRRVCSHSIAKESLVLSKQIKLDLFSQLRLYKHHRSKKNWFYWSRVFTAVIFFSVARSLVACKFPWKILQTALDKFWKNFSRCHWSPIRYVSNLLYWWLPLVSDFSVRRRYLYCSLSVTGNGRVSRSLRRVELLFSQPFNPKWSVSSNSLSCFYIK